MEHIFKGFKESTITGKIYKSTSVLTISILVAYLIIMLAWSSVSFYRNATKSTAQTAEIIGKSFDLFSEELEYKMMNTILSNEVQSNINCYYEGTQDFVTTRMNIIDALTQMVGTMTNTSGGDIVLNDGKVICGSDYFVNLPSVFYEELANDETYKPFSWLGPYELEHNRHNIRKVFVIQKRILDQYRYHQIGMLYLYVDEENIRNAFFETEHDNINYMITDQSGHVMLSEQSNNLTELQKFRVDQNESWKLFGHELHYLLQVPLKPDGLFLVAAVPFSSLFSSLLLLIAVLLGFSVCTIAVSLLSSKRISEVIAQPISVLARTMDDATKGNRKLRVEHAPKDEFEILSNSFNRLMDANEELIASISEKHRYLRYYEFSLFQQQIKPHFLYNALSNISALIKLDMKEEAINTVENLSKFFRLSLTGTDGIILIKDELDLIGKYFSVQKLRFQDKLTLTYQVEPEIMEQKIPKLTLQPLIENCIHHAMNLRSRKVSIEVRGYCVMDTVVLEVLDNGDGIPPETLREILENINDDNNKNFGLTAVNQRLKLIYGDQYKLDIESVVGEYTKVTVRLPYSEDEKNV